MSKISDFFDSLFKEEEPRIVASTPNAVSVLKDLIRNDLDTYSQDWEFVNKENETRLFNPKINISFEKNHFPLIQPEKGKFSCAGLELGEKFWLEMVTKYNQRDLSSILNKLLDRAEKSKEITTLDIEAEIVKPFEEDHMQKLFEHMAFMRETEILAKNKITKITQKLEEEKNKSEQLRTELQKTNSKIVALNTSIPSKVVCINTPLSNEQRILIKAAIERAQRNFTTIIVEKSVKKSNFMNIKGEARL